MNFHQKIKSLRLKEKQSQKELAELLNVTIVEQIVTNIENMKKEEVEKYHFVIM